MSVFCWGTAQVHTATRSQSQDLRLPRLCPAASCYFCLLCSATPCPMNGLWCGISVPLGTGHCCINDRRLVLCPSAAESRYGVTLFLFSPSRESWGWRVLWMTAWNIIFVLYPSHVHLVGWLLFVLKPSPLLEGNVIPTHTYLTQGMIPEIAAGHVNEWRMNEYTGNIWITLTDSSLESSNFKHLRSVNSMKFEVTYEKTYESGKENVDRVIFINLSVEDKNKKKPCGWLNDQLTLRGGVS